MNYRYVEAENPVRPERFFSGIVRANNLDAIIRSMAAHLQGNVRVMTHHLFRPPAQKILGIERQSDASTSVYAQQLQPYGPIFIREGREIMKKSQPRTAIGGTAPDPVDLLPEAPALLRRIQEALADDGNGIVTYHAEEMGHLLDFYIAEGKLQVFEAMQEGVNADAI